MINNKLLYFSITFSLLFHFTIIFFFTSKTNDKDIYVVNLSEFKEFTLVQPSPPKPKNIFKENTIKKIEENILQQNKILDNKEIITEKKKDIVPIKKKKLKKSLNKLKKSPNHPKNKFRKRKLKNRIILMKFQREKHRYNHQNNFLFKKINQLLKINYLVNI